MRKLLNQKLEIFRNHLHKKKLFEKFETVVLRNLSRWIKFQKTPTKQVITFLKSAFRFKERPAFLALSITFMLLPGSNYYLDLKLSPSEPFIKSLPIDLKQPAEYPIKSENIAPPNLSAKAAVVIDVNSAVILYSKNSQEQLLPASTTKIMTSLVALEHFKLDDVLTVKRAHRSIGQTMNLVVGENISVENLLHGLLIHSGNDAAFTLAENYRGGYLGFVSEMNNLSKKFNLNNTHFANVSGIDQKNHFTTVSDLARLSAVAMKNPVFAEIVSKPEVVVSNTDKTINHHLTNRNALLSSVKGIRGVKTGWTEQAGECLVTNTVRNGREIITVVLGSNDRFGDSKLLIEWTYQAHKWLDPNEQPHFSS